MHCFGGLCGDIYLDHFKNINWIVYTLIPMSQYGLMLPIPYRAVLPSYTEFAAFVSQSPGRHCNCSFSHWCWHGWITAAQLLLVCRFNFLMLLNIFQSVMKKLLDRFSLSGNMIMSLYFCTSFTGYVYRRESNTVCGAGVPLPTWNGSFVPVIIALAYVWRCFRTTPAESVNDGTGRI